MRAKVDKPYKTFPVEYSLDEHGTVKRRAKAAGISMHAYIVAMTVNGKLPKSK